MKSIYSILLLVSCLFFLTACPVSSAHPLGEKGKEKLDMELIGTWTNESVDTESTGITITKGEEPNTYNLHVDEQGSMFMAEGADFIGWLTTLNGKSFFVLQQVLEGVPVETYFVYHYKVENSILTTSDISLMVNGTDAITSIGSYQDEVRASMELDGFLSNEIQWTKKS